MSIDRLGIYNGALRICGERKLASLTENREPRYLLDDVWNGGGVQFCLEQGQWNFAKRTAMFDSDPSIDPPFGYQFGFTKPSDWVNTSAFCQDEFFSEPLRQYVDEAGVWYASLTPVYVSYVSNHANFGMNLAGWPRSFTDYVFHYFAGEIILKLTNSERRITYLKGPPGRPERGLIHNALVTAKNRDAMAKPPMRPAQGSWSGARQGDRGAGDGGVGGSLIG